MSFRVRHWIISTFVRLAAAIVNSCMLWKNKCLGGGKLVGYEVSKSRWLFAEKFKEWIGSQRVTNRNEDVLSSRTDEMFDLIIGADIVTQIISPLFDTAEQEYFRWIRRHLSDGGKVFLEFEDFSQTIAELGQQGVLSEWEEFPCEDPFQYGLYREYLDSDGNLVWDKRFFERSTREFSCFSNVIKNYTPEQACKTLSAAGFDLEIYDSPEIRAEFEITDLERHNNMFYVIAWKHD